MDEFEIAAVDDKPWRGYVGLDDVAELWMRVFQASWWMSGDGFLQEVVKDAGFALLVAAGVDVEGEVEQFGDVLAGN